jgi:hypothetical protein
MEHNYAEWRVVLHVEFVGEYQALVALTLNLCNKGPLLGRPLVDTLKGSRHANMKELRFRAEGGVWRIAFAFDPERKAVLLVAGNKAGIAQRRFYRDLIEVADKRFDRHLHTLRIPPRRPK